MQFFYGPQGSNLFMSDAQLLAYYRDSIGPAPYVNDPVPEAEGVVVPIIEDEEVEFSSSDTHNIREYV